MVPGMNPFSANAQMMNMLLMASAMPGMLSMGKFPESLNSSFVVKHHPHKKYVAG
jgi:hypothetical protein